MIANVADAMVVIGERTRERNAARAENERLRERVMELEGQRLNDRNALRGHLETIEQCLAAMAHFETALKEIANVRPCDMLGAPLERCQCIARAALEVDK